MAADTLGDPDFQDYLQVCWLLECRGFSRRSLHFWLFDKIQRRLVRVEGHDEPPSLSLWFLDERILGWTDNLFVHYRYSAADIRRELEKEAAPARRQWLSAGSVEQQPGEGETPPPAPPAETPSPPAKKPTGYPEELLLQELEQLTNAGWETRAAARHLAPRAEGPTSLESKADRLRSKLRKRKRAQVGE